MNSETAIGLINIIFLLYIIIDAVISWRRMKRWKRLYNIERERVELWKRQAEYADKVIREFIESKGKKDA